VDSFNPPDWPVIVRTQAFEDMAASLGLSEDDLQALQVEILKNPTRPPVIKGAGGARKIRFAKPGSGKGKSGAFRACYAHLPEFGQVLMVAIFGKKDKTDLTKNERDVISRFMSAYRTRLQQKNQPRESPGHRRSADDE
jgi:hypothetical protein